MIKLFNKDKKCIVCERSVGSSNVKKKFGVYFCSDRCVNEYEKLLEETKKDIKLDNCCD